MARKYEKVNQKILRILGNETYILFLRDKDGKDWEERAACM